jgi:hypothetical protein
MAINNHERVGKAMNSLKEGLSPLVEREFKNSFNFKDRERCNKLARLSRRRHRPGTGRTEAGSQTSRACGESCGPN